jgi:hypothetical protein
VERSIGGAARRAGQSSCGCAAGRSSHGISGPQVSILNLHHALCRFVLIGRKIQRGHAVRSTAASRLEGREGPWRKERSPKEGRHGTGVRSSRARWRKRHDGGRGGAPILIQEWGLKGRFGCPPQIGALVGALLELHFLTGHPYSAMGAQVGALLELFLKHMSETPKTHHHRRSRPTSAGNSGRWRSGSLSWFLRPATTFSWWRRGGGGAVNATAAIGEAEWGVARDAAKHKMGVRAVGNGHAWRGGVGQVRKGSVRTDGRQRLSISLTS